MGQVSFPFHIALKMGIKLVFYGENGELEYASDPNNIDKPYKPTSEWLNHYFKGSSLQDLIEFGLKKKKYFSKVVFLIQRFDFLSNPGLEKKLDRCRNNWKVFLWLL